jgi:sensory rhodopsin
MFGTQLQSTDLVATSYAAATMATFATAVLVMLGLSWTSERWRPPLALSGVVLLISSFAYLEASQVWLATQKMSADSRYVAWFTVQPMQVAALYFFTHIYKPVPAGVFWRTTLAAILMVLSRYLGDAGTFNPTLGALLSIAFWLYVLGEMYFGPMSAAAMSASRSVSLGYFWIRLIFTIGWAIYPILYFVDLVIGAGHSRGVIVLYTLADAVNLIVVSLIVLAVASQERY